MDRPLHIAIAMLAVSDGVVPLSSMKSASGRRGGNAQPRQAGAKRPERKLGAGAYITPPLWRLLETSSDARPSRPTRPTLFSGVVA